MKKLIFISVVLALVIVSVSTILAQKSRNNIEFKKLYHKTVTKLSSAKTSDITIGVVQIVYERKHSCLCKDKQCHGSRLTLTMNSGKTTVSIFPNGDCFAETNHFSPGVDMVSIDPTVSTNEEKLFLEEAKKILLAYTE